jgi:hypothetical protein
VACTISNSTLSYKRNDTSLQHKTVTVNRQHNVFTRCGTTQAEHASFRHISAQVFLTHGGDLYGGFIGDTLVIHGVSQKKEHFNAEWCYETCMR